MTGIRVLHVVGGGLDGGAARGAYWLHLALRQQGVDSRLLVADPSPEVNNTDIFCAVNSRADRIGHLLRRKTERLCLRVAYPHRMDTPFSPGMLGMQLDRNPHVAWADIVHLHWINASFVDISSLPRVQKKLVWTLRDMWPFTGGCHYALDCQRFKTGCGGCPQLGSSNESDISGRMARQKLKLFSSAEIHLVGISDWITGMANQSFVLSEGVRAHTIHNAINTADFSPVARDEARRLLGLPQEGIIILAGAHNLDQQYKGSRLLPAALAKLGGLPATVVLFGKMKQVETTMGGMPVVNMGFVSDNRRLAAIYSAADVFVATSIQEAFGKTIAESISCRTPAVCFAGTGGAEIIRHHQNGYVVPVITPDALAEGIRWAAQTGKKQLVEDSWPPLDGKFDTATCARRYADLYRELLSNTHCTAAGLSFWKNPVA